MAMDKRHNEILERLDETNKRLDKIEKQLEEKSKSEPTKSEPTKSEPTKSDKVKTLEDLGLSEAQIKALQAAGYGSPIQLRAISDETLGAVKGIGPATVKEIREKLG